MKQLLRKTPGFTLIETVIAMAIMAGALIVLANSWGSGFKILKKSKQQHEVALLLERKLTELDLEFGGKPLSEIPEEREEDFGKEFPNVRWKMISKEFEMPDLTPLIKSGDEAPDPMLVTLFTQLGEVINKSVKEVKVSIIIKEGSRSKEFSAVTYFIDYDQGISLGGGGGLPE